MNKNMKKIRIGVLGAANIALRSVIPSIQSLENKFELVGVATRSLNKEKESDELQYMNGYQALLDMDIDAVYIPLPNSLHYEWVKKALEKDIHVLVEKSLGCNLNEVLELNQIAKKKNLVLVENFQFRFHSQLQFIREQLESKILGDIRIVRSTFCFPPFADSNNIRYKKDLGGGALLDAGAYPIKLSQIILGNDLEVTSAVLNKGKDQDVDVWGGAFLKQKNKNLFSQIAFGFDNYYQCNVEILGSKGKLYTNRIFTAKASFEPKIIVETNEKGLREITLNPDDHFKNMISHFYDLISGEKHPEREYEDNINQSRLLHELKAVSQK